MRGAPPFDVPPVQTDVDQCRSKRAARQQVKQPALAASHNHPLFTKVGRRGSRRRTHLRRRRGQRASSRKPPPTLSITQQAVSKRIAVLERDLDVRLFTRTARGARLTIDGQAFLPHARELLRVAERADASVRPGRRALRVDVVNRRIVTAVPPPGLPPRTSRDRAGRRDPGRRRRAARSPPSKPGRSTPPSTRFPRSSSVPDAIRTAPVIDEPHQLLVGPRHPLANARSVTPAQLAGHRIWMPGLDARGEVAVYYDELAAAFGITIDVVGTRLRKRGTAGRDRRLLGPRDPGR